MAPRTRSMAAALPAPSSPTASASTASTPFSPLFDTDLHSAPSSASSWDPRQDPQWPGNQQQQHYTPPTPGHLFNLLWRGVPGFLRPGPFSSAYYVNVGFMGCQFTIEEFLDNILTNPINTLGIRFPETRTFRDYRHMLADKIYWDTMLGTLIVGIVVVFALRLLLEVMLYSVMILLVWLVLMKPVSYLTPSLNAAAGGVWKAVAFHVHEFVLLPEADTTWLLDEYSPYHITNNAADFQPGMQSLAEPNAGYVAGHGAGLALNLHGDKVVGVGRVLLRMCQITENYHKICAAAPLNISALYIPTAPMHSISAWGLMINEQLRSEVSCFNQLAHRGPKGDEVRQTSCYDSDARRSRILKLETTPWRGQ